MTDENGKSRGFGFVSYDEHESAQKVRNMVYFQHQLHYKSETDQENKVCIGFQNLAILKL